MTAKLNELLKKSLLEVQQLRSALRKAELSASEPIAIIGMACRAPGGIADPEAYWSLLAEGRDAIRPFPARFRPESVYDPNPDSVGKSYVREAGYLDHIDEFDAALFGISPREAAAMDPQQRIALEVSWEALERAGICPTSLNESKTGVYLGAMRSDYGQDDTSLEALDGYRGTGVASSVLAGRISYALGLQGPSIAVDTACSSSLVALHLACSALRQRECDLALGGGVTVMCTPSLIVEFSRLRASSPDGRCKAFSEEADGAGWAEGCGMVVLKRLSDAQCDGDHVLAVIRGSAVNQDGKSQGLTAPNGPSQTRLIRRALEVSRLVPEDIDAIEAHGTGTSLGDPIEAGALADVFGPARSADRPIWLGSSKSNLGHTQAAAGVLGVIKMVLALRHDRLPRSLHSERPSEHIPWSEAGLSLLQDAREWPRRADRPRRAGISSFGISGTNAHVIVEDAPTDESPNSIEMVATIPLLVSGRGEKALREQASRWATWLEDHSEATWSDVLRTAALRRAHLESRAALSVSGHDDAIEALGALSRGTPHPLVVSGTLRERRGAVFVFPGQGSQWTAMGRALMDQSEVFASAVDACDAALRPFLGWSVRSLLRGEAPPEALPFERADVVQPALFAMSIGLSAVWRGLGVEPTAVVGQSQGEIAAAVVCGALSLEDGSRVVALRSQLIQRLSGTGAMAVIELSADAVELRLTDPMWSGMSVAAVNTVTSTVVAGSPEAIETWVRQASEDGIFCRRIAVEYASHSAHVDPILGELETALGTLTPRTAAVTMISTVSGEPIDGSRLDAEYWCRNLRQPVRLDRSLTHSMASGHDVFVEMSPHPMLALPIGAASAERDVVVLHSLVRDEGGLAPILRNLGEAHTRGVSVDWSRVLGHGIGAFAPLPTYAFQRHRHWLDAPERISAEQERTEPRSRLGRWLYSVGWDAVPTQRAGSRSGRILWIVADDDAWGEWASCLHSGAIAAGLESSVVSLSNGVSGESTLLEGASETEVVLLASIAEHVEESLSALVRTIQSGVHLGAAKLWIMTKCALAVHPDDPVAHPMEHMVWGLGRTVGIEHGDRWGGLIDLPARPIEGDASRVLALLSSSRDAGDELALRGSRVFGRRLRRHSSQGASSTWRTSGTVLVTGGTGALGRHVARWLAASGAEHLVLVSRQGPSSPHAPEVLAELQKLGATAEVIGCDVAQRDDVERVFRTIADGRPPLRSVFHTAGIGEASAFLELDEAIVTRTLEGKVNGARWLDELTREVALDAFVLYGSLSDLWGAPGFAAYAAANAALVGLAAHRRTLGLRAASIYWGPWADGGMLDDDLEANLRLQGVPPMLPSDALEALGIALAGSPDADVAVADVEWARFAPAFAVRAATCRLLHGVPEARDVLRVADGLANGFRNEGDAEADDLRHLAPEVLARVIRARVIDALRSVLRLDPNLEVEPSRRPLDMGLNSLMSVELTRTLRQTLGVPIPAASMLRAATVEDLVQLALEPFVPSNEDASEEVAGILTIRAVPAEVVGSWLVPIVRPANPTMRLVCFAYAGGGAAVYSSWRGRLPDDVELLSVELPGRGCRLDQPFVRSLADIGDAVRVELEGMIDLPLMIFGHCLGAIAAFEFCRSRLSHGGSVRHVFASGAPAPHLYAAASVTSLDDDELFEMIEEIGLSGLQAMKQDPEFMRVAMRVMRDDMRLAAEYDLLGGGGIRFPVTAFSATSDGFASTGAVDAWRDYAERPNEFKHYQYSGGHYFIETERASILGVVTEAIQADLAESSARRRPAQRLAANGRASLVVVPNAISCRADFEPVVQGLRRELDVHLLEPPGYGERGGSPLRRLEPLASLLEDELSSVQDPVVLFGHFFSAHVCLAVAQRRLARGLPVRRIVVSCSAAPARYFMPPWRLPASERLLARSVRERLAEDPSYAPRLDAELSAAFHYCPGPELEACVDVPVTAIVARDDQMVPPGSVPAWARVTRGPFQLVEVEGGHMFHVRNPDALRGILDAECEHADKRL